MIQACIDSWLQQLVDNLCRVGVVEQTVFYFITGQPRGLADAAFRAFCGVGLFHCLMQQPLQGIADFDSILAITEYAFAQIAQRYRVLSLAL